MYLKTNLLSYKNYKDFLLSNSYRLPIIIYSALLLQTFTKIRFDCFAVYQQQNQSSSHNFLGYVSSWSLVYLPKLIMVKIPLKNLSWAVMHTCSNSWRILIFWLGGWGSTRVHSTSKIDAGHKGIWNFETLWPPD